MYVQVISLWPVRLLLTQVWTPCHGLTWARIAGNCSNELAKITGITPDWLTFSGI